MKENSKRNWVAVMDFGSQYAHLIVRRIRELGVYSEIVPYDASYDKLEGAKAIILSGGPASVYLPNSPKPKINLVDLKIPILGICYGHQLISFIFGAEVGKAKSAEFGKTILTHNGNGKILKGLPSNFIVWMSHSDEVKTLPSLFKVVASTESCKFAALEHEKLPIFTVQFHPEVFHTQYGNEIFSKFLFEVCKCEKSWSIKDYAEEMINFIKKEVNASKAICAVSGGVDSTTAAFLTQEAIGDNLAVLFIDTGLLRENEAKNTLLMLKKIFGSKVHFVDASKQFLEKLRTIKDPEQKRKIIGEEFIRIFEEEAKKLGNFEYLVQGTLYPDIIESAAVSGPASKIKSHHNVGGLPEKMKFKLIEPLKYLYKDEVRKLAESLGLPAELIKKHPFPGPGLAVRIIGEVTEEKLEICRKANKIVEEELIKANLYDKVWQAFAIVGDDKATGVKGDERSYGYIVTVRIVESVDAMTASWSRVPYDLLDSISKRITNEISNVTWITYAIVDKPPSTIEPQ
ncbi:MAG: glutamine-hydrolyzing GMP synthase [Thermoproteota archaeon]|nr:glutamine-hydrolyzing GMP synthase [Candidatus Brockarchaeota archaeon]